MATRNSASDVAVRIRHHLWSIRAAADIEVKVEDVMRALTDHSGPEVMAGVNQGVLQGWWWNAPNGSIRPTKAGVASD